MRLRRHRRNVVVWRSSRPPADRDGAPRHSRPARIGQVRRLIRIGMLLTIIAVRPRWGFLLAGTALTAIGVIERNGVTAVVLIPGLMLLWQALLIPGDTDADHRRRAQLARELAAFSTPAQRRDLEATLDRYPDGITDEMRAILTSQAVTAAGNGASR
jgi:hypothetical protein